MFLGKDDHFKFSKEALGASSKKGALPIVLIDVSTLIDIMIEKKFGIDIQNLPIYINALDEVIIRVLNILPHNRARFTSSCSFFKTGFNK